MRGDFEAAAGAAPRLPLDDAASQALAALLAAAAGALGAGALCLRNFAPALAPLAHSRRRALAKGLLASVVGAKQRLTDGATLALLLEALQPLIRSATAPGVPEPEAAAGEGAGAPAGRAAAAPVAAGAPAAADAALPAPAPKADTVGQLEALVALLGAGGGGGGAGDFEMLLLTRDAFAAGGPAVVPRMFAAIAARLTALLGGGGVAPRQVNAAVHDTLRLMAVAGSVDAAVGGFCDAAMAKGVDAAAAQAFLCQGALRVF